MFDYASDRARNTRQRYCGVRVSESAAGSMSSSVKLRRRCRHRRRVARGSDTETLLTRAVLA